MSGVNFNSVGSQLSKNTNAAGDALTNRMNNNFDSTNPDGHDGCDAQDRTTGHWRSTLSLQP